MKFYIDGDEYTADALPQQGPMRLGFIRPMMERLELLEEGSPLWPELQIALPNLLPQQEVVQLVNILLAYCTKSAQKYMLQKIRTKIEEDRQVVLTRLKTARKQIQDDEAAVFSLNTTLDSLNQLEEKWP